jgi:hypothetical protein
MKTTAIKKFFQRHLIIIFITFLIIFGIVFRFLPHPPNFAPIAAIGLFSGFFIKRKAVLFIPLGAMMISDFFIGSYQPSIMLSVYLSFALIALIGYFNRHRLNANTVIGSSLIGSVLFFLLTNLAVWKFSGLYPLNLEGLTSCFYLALPFFRNTLAGDLFFTGVFFSAWQLAKTYLTVKNQTNSYRSIRS